MTKLKIKVTKEVLRQSALVLRQSAFCFGNSVGENCAIALAVRDIFPNAWVEPNRIIAKTSTSFDYDDIINLPDVASRFIKVFDSLSLKSRLRLPEIEFEIEIPDSIIKRINIDEIRPLLVNHPTLELV